jgi:hypothetical protein
MEKLIYENFSNCKYFLFIMFLFEKIHYNYIKNQYKSFLSISLKKGWSIASLLIILPYGNILNSFFIKSIPFSYYKYSQIHLILEIFLRDFFDKILGNWLANQEDFLYQAKSLLLEFQIFEISEIVDLFMMYLIKW